MNDLLIILLLILAAAAALGACIRRHAKGGCPCGGDCGCDCSTCHQKQDKK